MWNTCFQGNDSFQFLSSHSPPLPPLLPPHAWATSAYSSYLQDHHCLLLYYSYA